MKSHPFLITTFSEKTKIQYILFSTKEKKEKDPGFLHMKPHKKLLILNVSASPLMTKNPSPLHNFTLQCKRPVDSLIQYW
jgi:hypothetical protein